MLVAVLLAVCLIAAPTAGLVAANAATNPLGEGPGGLHVVLGVAIPAPLSYFTARHAAGRTQRGAAVWALASVVATGALLVVLFLFVVFVIRPVYGRGMVDL